MGPDSNAPALPTSLACSSSAPGPPGVSWRPQGGLQAVCGSQARSGSGQLVAAGRPRLAWAVQELQGCRQERLWGPLGCRVMEGDASRCNTAPAWRGGKRTLPAFSSSEFTQACSLSNNAHCPSSASGDVQWLGHGAHGCSTAACVSPLISLAPCRPCAGAGCWSAGPFQLVHR